MRRRFALAVAMAVSVLAGVTVANSQAFPERPVTLVVPFAPGGVPDSAGRILADRMAANLGQPVVVENRPGAGGYIGSASVAQAAPDGYTVLVGLMGTMAASVPLSPDLPYKPLEDFRPVSMLFGTPNILIAANDAPFSTMQELIDYAKAHPGEVTFASTGVGTASHLAAALFMSLTGIEMTHIPYQGSAPALTDLVAGRVDVMFGYLFNSAPQVQAGNLKALVHFGQARPASLPDVPTLGEVGFPPDAMSPSWMGLMVPAGTPDAVVARLITATETAMASDQMVAYMAKNSDQPIHLSGDAMRDFITSEIALWTRVTKGAGITLQAN